MESSEMNAFICDNISLCTKVSFYVFFLFCTLFFSEKKRDCEIRSVVFPISLTPPLPERQQKLDKNGKQTFVKYR
jgi:hypothetical protein